jgi:hypothetical protein
MKKDYFREGSALQKGRRKIYELLDGNIELLNPKDGKLVDYLQKGELVYVVKSVDENNEKMIVFKVMKFAKDKSKNLIFKAKKDLFKKHYTEDESNAEGDTANTDTKKTNYGIPVITGLGLGAVAFLIAQKYNKNLWLFTIGGLALGGFIGHIAVNGKSNKK